MIPDAIRPFFSRILAGWLAAAAVYLNGKYGITLSGDTQAAIITLAFAIFSTVYSITHRVIDKRVNPGDAAGSHYAVREKEESDRLPKP
jgi:small basic protein